MILSIRLVFFNYTRMSFNTKRYRFLAFRLTDSEYELVRAVSNQEGSGSIASFARRAVLNEVKRQGVGNLGFTDDLVTLTLRLQELDAALNTICVRIAQLLGNEYGARKENT